VDVQGAAEHAAWKANFEKYAEAFPELAAQLKRQLAHKLPDGWKVGGGGGVVVVNIASIVSFEGMRHINLMVWSRFY